LKRKNPSGKPPCVHIPVKERQTSRDNSLLLFGHTQQRQHFRNDSLFLIQDIIETFDLKRIIPLISLDHLLPVGVFTILVNMLCQYLTAYSGIAGPAKA